MVEWLKVIGYDEDSIPHRETDRKDFLSTHPLPFHFPEVVNWVIVSKKGGLKTVKQE